MLRSQDLLEIQKELDKKYSGMEKTRIIIGMGTCGIAASLTTAGFGLAGKGRTWYSALDGILVDKWSYRSCNYSTGTYYGNDIYSNCTCRRDSWCFQP